MGIGESDVLDPVVKCGAMGISPVGRFRICVRGNFPCEFAGDIGGSFSVLDSMGKEMIFSGLIRTTSLGKNGTLVFSGPGNGTFHGFDFDAIVLGVHIGSYCRSR